MEVDNTVHEITLIEFERFKDMNLIVNDIAAGTQHSLILTQPKQYEEDDMFEEGRQVWAIGDG